MAHVVCAELYLVSFLGGAVWWGHDTGIVDQDIEARFLALECRCRVGNGRERRQVEREKYDLAGIWHAVLDVGDGIAGFGFGTSGEVDARGAVGSEVCDGLFA